MESERKKYNPEKVTREENVEVPKDVEVDQVEDQESEPTQREQYELKDSEGNSLGFVNAEFASVLDDERLPEGTRKLSTCVLENNGKQVNLFDVVDTEQQYPVFITNGYKTPDDKPIRFSYHIDQKRILAPPLDSSLGLSGLLHEFGHAQQFEEPFFQHMEDQMQWPTELVWDKDPSQVFEEVRDVFPQLSDACPSDEQLEPIRDARLEILRAHAHVEAEEKKLSTFKDEVASYKRETYLKWGDPWMDSIWKGRKEEYEQLKEKEERESEALRDAVDSQEKILQQANNEYFAAHKTFDAISKPFNDIFLAPLRYSERDATRRAFKWMKRIQDEIDMNLFASINLPEDAMADSNVTDDCVDSIKTGIDIAQGELVVSPRDYLIRALETYDALKKIPVPSRKDMAKLSPPDEEDVSI